MTSSSAVSSESSSYWLDVEKAIFNAQPRLSYSLQRIVKSARSERGQ
jgi:hypothetical protein